MEEYIIQHNGSEPYIVHIYPSTIEVYRQKYINEYENGYSILDKKMIDTTYHGVFIGDNLLQDPHAAPPGTYPGNTILVHLMGQHYLFIGHEIYSCIIPNDSIQEYYSPVGNNAVPYPYALGERYAYLLLDDTYIPLEMFDITKDVYTQ